MLVFNVIVLMALSSAMTYCLIKGNVVIKVVPLPKYSKAINEKYESEIKAEIEKLRDATEKYNKALEEYNRLVSGVM